jgi:hypothetical protein
MRLKQRFSLKQQVFFYFNHFQEVGPIRCLGESTAFQDKQTSIDFGHALLDSLVVEVDAPELFIVRVLQQVPNKRATRFETQFSDTRRTHVSVEGFNRGYSVLDLLNGSLFLLFFLYWWGLTTKSFASVLL